MLAKFTKNWTIFQRIVIPIVTIGCFNLLVILPYLEFRIARQQKDTVIENAQQLLTNQLKARKEYSLLASQLTSLSAKSDVKKLDIHPHISQGKKHQSSLKKKDTSIIRYYSYSNSLFKKSKRKISKQRKEALRHLSKSKSERFYWYTFNENKNTFLRVATLEKMNSKSCIRCHKKQKLTQTSGVLEVTVPFNKASIFASLPLYLEIFLLIIFMHVLVGIIIFSLARKLSHSMTSIVTDFEKIATGELSIELKSSPLKEVGSLQKTINELLNRLRELTYNIIVSRDRASEVTNKAISETDKVLKLNQNQASYLEETSAAIEELSSSTQSIFTSTKVQLNVSSENSQSMTELMRIQKEGNEIRSAISSEVERTVSQAKIGRENILQSVQNMKEIRKTSSHILQIIDVINDITDQTNLLALNASIEAARAGEHGKGFTIVAKEISQLADKSTSSAKQIFDLLQEANDKAQTGSKQIEVTAETFTMISKSMESLSELTAKIHQQSELQQRFIEETMRRVNKGSELAKEITTATETQKNTSEQINDDILQMHEITGQSVEQVEKLTVLMKELQVTMEDGLELLRRFNILKE